MYKCTIKTLINQKKDFWKTDIRAGAESAPRWNHFILKKNSKDHKSLTERKNDNQRRPKNSKKNF